MRFYLFDWREAGLVLWELLEWILAALSTEAASSSVSCIGEAADPDLSFLFLFLVEDATD